MGWKRCPACNSTMELSKFGNSRHTKDGKTCYCKDCGNQKHAEWKAKNKEKAISSMAKSRANNRDDRQRKDREKYAQDPEKNREKTRRYRAANPEAGRLYSAKYRAENKEKVAAQEAKYRADNAHAVRARSSDWRRRNPERSRMACQVRRARKRLAMVGVSVDIESKLMRMQRGMCACCKIDIRGGKFQLDHIEPLARGGKHEDRNLQLLCQLCNGRKWAKNPEEFMRSQGFLL